MKAGAVSLILFVKDLYINKRNKKREQRLKRKKIEMTIALQPTDNSMFLVCAASVSVGLSAGLKLFRFLNAKIGASAKKVREGGREGRFPSLASPAPPCSFHQCCARPNFRAAKKRKMPRTGEKTETLATQATMYRVWEVGKEKDKRMMKD